MFRRRHVPKKNRYARKFERVSGTNYLNTSTDYYQYLDDDTWTLISIFRLDKDASWPDDYVIYERENQDCMLYLQDGPPRVFDARVGDVWLNSSTENPENGRWYMWAISNTGSTSAMEQFVWCYDKGWLPDAYDSGTSNATATATRAHNIGRRVGSAGERMQGLIQRVVGIQNIALGYKELKHLALRPEHIRKYQQSIVLDAEMDGSPSTMYDMIGAGTTFTVTGKANVVRVESTPFRPQARIIPFGTTAVGGTTLDVTSSDMPLSGEAVVLDQTVAAGTSDTPLSGEFVTIISGGVIEVTSSDMPLSGESAILAQTVVVGTSDMPLSGEEVDIAQSVAATSSDMPLSGEPVTLIASYTIDVGTSDMPLSGEPATIVTITEEDIKVGVGKRIIPARSFTPTVTVEEIERRIERDLEEAAEQIAEIARTQAIPLEEARRRLSVQIRNVFLAEMVLAVLRENEVLGKQVEAMEAEIGALKKEVILLSDNIEATLFVSMAANE